MMHPGSAGHTDLRVEPLKASNGSRKPLPRRFPIGAEVLPDGGVHFRVWAPAARSVALGIIDNSGRGIGATELQQEAKGYWSLLLPDAKPGLRYKIELDGKAFPDPVSRFQPEGPHGPSEVVDHTFNWTDVGWKGVQQHGQVIYEMHIGTFTKEGTWDAATRQLPQLAELGVTLLEVMPVAEFPGRFGWGYDGVDLFAPTKLYGTPTEMRQFVNRAHELGLGVILDVVYNHIGPDGNYLKPFSPNYFTDKYKNEWGEALNFDGPENNSVREFFVTNAVYWITEFHLDGLRLDATQAILDSSPKHILAEISDEIRKAAGERQVYIVGENEPQHSHLLWATSKGGCGLDSLWNDDFHHAARAALTGRKEAYYNDYAGSPQEFISAAKYGYLYQGQWYAWQKTPRGEPALDIEPHRFVTFIQNHDQVANSLAGKRIHDLTTPGRFRAGTALFLLLPGTPMLFQGQEFAASTPFLYFADHNPELAPLVAKGRCEFLCQFPSIDAEESRAALPRPHDEQTYLRCKLKAEERSSHFEVLRMHKDLLKLRREDPVFSASTIKLDGAVLGPEAFMLRFFGPGGHDRVLLVNFGLDLRLSPIPEPLLAPPRGAIWTVLWNSESISYGGCGCAAAAFDDTYKLPGHSAIVFASQTKLSEKQVRNLKAVSDA